MTSFFSTHHHPRSLRHRTGSARGIRPTVAYRQRGVVGEASSHFSAPETWHEPTGRTATKFVVQPAGNGFIHVVTVEEVRARIALLPDEFASGIEVIQLGSMTRKRSLFPLYGMQWGPNVYLYPMEASLTETYHRAPTNAQRIEARMYGGAWSKQGDLWKLTWTPETIRDFYLNNVLIHEIGHVHDHRNTKPADRERYANWFAIEYGYRPSRGRT